jgi:hypothetical protein
LARAVDPAELAVAVDVVVAVLGAAELVAVGDHRHALGQQERGEEFALTPLAQCGDVGIVGGASTPLFQDRLWLSPVAVVLAVASVRMKPSCAVTMLIDAIGRRPSNS